MWLNHKIDNTFESESSDDNDSKNHTGKETETVLVIFDAAAMLQNEARDFQVKNCE